MASLFDGWTNGSGAFQPKGSADWSSFYGSVYSGLDIQRAYNKVAGPADPVGNAPGFDALKLFKQGGNTLADGTTVQSVSRAVDFMNRIFGVSPLAGDFYKDQDTGETVAPGTGAPDVVADLSAGFGSIVGRAAIIILGFIFVAVGLSMFRDPAIAAVRAAVS